MVLGVLCVPKCVDVVLLEIGSNLRHEYRDASNHWVNCTTVIAQEVSFFNPIFITLEYVEIQRE
jgi:hypothetical protein